MILQGSYWPDQRDQFVYGIEETIGRGPRRLVTLIQLEIFVFSGLTLDLITDTGRGL